MGITSFIAEGGVWSYLVLFFGVFGPLCSAAYTLIIGMLRVRVPMTLGWLGLVFPLVLGCIGCSMSLFTMQMVLETASPEVVSNLTANGMAVALVPMWVSQLLASAGFLLVAMCGAVVAVAAPGPDALLDKKALTRSLLGAVMGSVLAGLVVVLTADLGMLGSAALPVSAMLIMSATATITTVVGASRYSETSAKDQSRMAGVRGFVMVSCICACLFLAAGCSRYAQMEGLRALVLAAPDVRDVLLATIEATRRVVGAVGFGSVLPAALSGFFGLSPLFGRIDGRVSLGGALGGLYLLVLGAAYLSVMLSMNQLSGLPS